MGNSTKRQMQLDRNDHVIRVKNQELERKEREAKIENEKKQIELQHKREMEKIRQEESIRSQKLAMEKREREEKIASEKRRIELQHKKEMEQIAKDDFIRQEKLKMEKIEQEKRLEKERKEMELKHEEEVRKLKQQEKRALEKQLNLYQTQINEKTKKINELKKLNEEAKSQLKQAKDKKDNITIEKDKDIQQWKKEKNFDNIKKYLDQAEKEISSGIKKTGQFEKNIGTFLQLTQNLVTATAVNQDNSNKLASIIEAFGTNIERATMSDLKCDTYIPKKERTLKRILPVLEEEELKDMEDLVCDDEEDFEEMVERINDGLQELKETMEENKEEEDNNNSNNEKEEDDKKSKKKKNKKNQDPYRPLEKREIRKFKKLCMESKWKKDQQKQEKVAKSVLEGMSPILGKYFSRTYETMQIADKILSIDSNSKLNQEQQESIMNLDVKEIELPDNNNDKLLNDKEEKDNSSLVKRESIPKEVEKVVSTDVISQTKALSYAAVKSIHVVQSMLDDFDNDPSELSIGLAKGIESSCKQLIRCQGNIRQSWVLANEIIKLKPGNLKPEAKVLWDAVDTGILQIFDNILEMSKVSSKFFGYFLKFNNSFKYFLNANKDPDVDLMISMQFVVRDTKDFKKFSLKFEQQVEKLGKKALNIIGQCLKNTVGAKQFETAIENREKYRGKYATLLKQLNNIELKWEEKIATIFQEFYDAEASVESFKFQIKLAQENLELVKKAREGCQEMLSNIKIN